jgi:hypothetical protein
LPGLNCARGGGEDLAIASTVPRKESKPKRAKGRRSPAQRDYNAALGIASAAFKGLTIEEIRSWNAYGSARRMSGQQAQNQCNARRLLEGIEMLRRPPPDTPFDPNGQLKRVLITYTRGRIRIQLELMGATTARITVWASRPLDRWVSRCYKVPRLGPLPPAKGGLSDITELYVKRHGRPKPGQWFSLRLRQEQGQLPIGCGAADVFVPERASAAKGAKAE